MMSQKASRFQLRGLKTPIFIFPIVAVSIGYDFYTRGKRGFLEPSTYATEILFTRSPHFPTPKIPLLLFK